MAKVSLIEECYDIGVEALHSEIQHIKQVLSEPPPYDDVLLERERENARRALVSLMKKQFDKFEKPKNINIKLENLKKLTNNPLILFASQAGMSLEDMMTFLNAIEKADNIENAKASRKVFDKESQVED